jgi:penicillin-binding protein 1B
MRNTGNTRNRKVPYRTQTRRRTYSSSRPITRTHRTTNSRIKRPIKRPPPREHTGSRFKWFWKLFWIIIMIMMIFVGRYVVALDEKVREQFEGRRWALPARVFARPLELYTDKRLTATALEEELKALGYREVHPINESGQYQRKGDTFLITTRTFKFWDATDPSRMVRVSIENNRVKSISELHPNRQLALFRLPPKLIGKIYPTHHEDRLLVSANELPPVLVDALIAVEDRSFFYHFGISIKGLLRAALTNWRAGKNVQGGSTITQQLVKNFYLTSERTFKRKFNEALMSILLEWHYSKEQILEAYMNEVYLGQDGKRAIHGMAQAARFYFGRPLKEIKLPQAALLVGLIRGASIYNPRRYPERAKERRDLVLDLMIDQGMISSRDGKIAKSTSLGIVDKKDIVESTFPYPAFIGLVRRQLHKDYDEKDLRSEGLQVFTTLDPYIQKLGEQVMKDGIKRLRRTSRRARTLEGAMVITGTENGEVLALVNGTKPHYEGFNRPLNAVRQIGSVVKPAVYLTALENPRRFSLTTRISDAPYTWRGGREVWRPKNYDHRSHGNVPLYRALAFSYNLATVRLGMKVGLSKVYETLKRLGVERESLYKRRLPSMLLGTIQLSPVEVTQMYQTIASGGFRVPVRAIREVLDYEGKPLQRYALSVEQPFEEGPIFLLQYALRQVLQIGTGRKVRRTLPASMVLAGKTGTTNDSRDSWFAGFSSELVVVTWVGRDDNKPMGLSGGNGAMVLWRDFIKLVRPESLKPVTPNSVKWRGNIPYITRRNSVSNNMLAGQ